MWYVRIERPVLRLRSGTYTKGSVVEVTEEEFAKQRLQSLVDNKVVTVHARNPVETVAVPSPVKVTPVKVRKEDLLTEAASLGISVSPSIKKSDLLELVAGAKAEHADAQQPSTTEQ